MSDYEKKPAQPIAEAEEAGGDKEWKTGFWDCCNSETCMMTALCCFCGNLGLGANYYMLQKKMGKDSGTAVIKGLAMCICPILSCVWAGPTRTEIRTKYGLKQAPCSDCLSHICYVSPCAVCQEYRQISEDDFTPVVTKADA